MAERDRGKGSISTAGALIDQPIAGWVRVIVILGAGSTAMGAVIALVYPAMLVSPHDEINNAVRIYAGYLVARNLAIALLLMVLLVLGAKRALGNLMALVGMIQLLDVCMDVAEGRWSIVPGILVFGIVFLVGAARLSGYAFWRSEAWSR
ncbi:MAG: hypothetical protein ABSD67_14160 [Terracidiphilus sp.]|jgi:hypothetical protein